MVKQEFDVNQGIKGGKYSILKIFSHQEKLKSFITRKISAPIYIRIKPTNACCHNCFYCVYNPEFSSIHPESNRQDMIPKEKMLEILKDLREMNVKAVTYSGGGEPLTYPHILDVLRKTIDYRIDLSMITNGQHLSGEAAELLGKGRWVRVSLDYPDENTFVKIRGGSKDRFQEIKRNIKNFASTKNPHCSLGVNCVVHEYNFDKLIEIAKFCKELEISDLRFAPVWKKNFEEYHAPFKDKAIEQIKMAQELQDPGFSVGSTYERYFERSTGMDIRPYKRCFYMECVPVIAADQNVYTCHNNAYEKEGKIGSIKDRSFKEFWFSPEASRFIGRFNPQTVCTHECSNDEKNRLLNEWFDCMDERVVNFV